MKNQQYGSQMHLKMNIRELIFQSDSMMTRVGFKQEFMRLSDVRCKGKHTLFSKIHCTTAYRNYKNLQQEIR